MAFRPFILTLVLAVAAFSQVPTIEPGVSHDLAKWRAAHYGNVRYKLNLTLEKMSPVLKGSMEIRVNVSAGTQAPSPTNAGSSGVTDIPIILDWRRIKGHEEKSTISNVSLNGVVLSVSPLLTRGLSQPGAQVGSGGATYLFSQAGDKSAQARASARAIADRGYEESNEHLIFRDGVVLGENVIKLDLTSPILTSGSAITRYIDKEDGSEYVYSLFVPSDASTAFPVFDQPDLKAKFKLFVSLKKLSSRNVISNTQKLGEFFGRDGVHSVEFAETLPISTYLFSFAAGNFVEYFEKDSGGEKISRTTYYDNGTSTVYEPRKDVYRIYVRQSQEQKFTPHSEEIFRLNREGIKFLEKYFDYKFPFPKYDLVLIPEFPFGGMEHAGATFLRESAIIFPQEPTKSDHISRANLIFHEAAHQWFGDTVTMKWFDDLWLKEGFATFAAYKALEKVMPEANAWKVFYERVKQAAYQTDSTRGTTPIYQRIDNLSAAKSAYGNIVYNKAPAFLRQAEFYLGEDAFQKAVRAFLKKHEYANAGWEDLVNEFETASRKDLDDWANVWVKQRGLPKFRIELRGGSSPMPQGPPTVQTMGVSSIIYTQQDVLGTQNVWKMHFKLLYDHSLNRFFQEITAEDRNVTLPINTVGFAFIDPRRTYIAPTPVFVFSNFGDYGYGLFLLDSKSRDLIISRHLAKGERDDFLRSMMWGSLWDSVRENELNPKDYVKLVIDDIKSEEDEGTIQSILSRVSIAVNYYLNDTQRERITPDLEKILEERIANAKTVERRITFYRAYLNLASSAKAQKNLKDILAGSSKFALPALRTKDKFDIVTRLAVSGDPDALKLLAELEKTETSDDAKRYAYAARAGFATAENKAKYWNDFVNNKDISESWIEAAFGPWNSIRHSELTLPYLQKALQELPNHKRSRKIFFVNGWLGAFIGGQRSEEALSIVNKFLADNPSLDNDLRLKILENVDLIERAVRIRQKFN
ncbi:MAG: M1 family aminopeptidase [Pyrinomonadaceae bacterium]